MICSDIWHKGINTRSDISKLLYVISRAVRQVACEWQKFLLAHRCWGTFREEERPSAAMSGGETSAVRRLLGKSKLRQFWNIMSGIYAKYHVRIMLLFVYTTTRKRLVIFTCRYFKFTALSQSDCRNFSFCSKTALICNFTCEITKLLWQPFMIRLSVKMATKF